MMTAYKTLCGIFELISLDSEIIKQMRIDLQLKPAKTEAETEKRVNAIARKSAELYNPIRNDEIAGLFAKAKEERLDQWQHKNLALMWDAYQRNANLPTEVAAKVAQTAAAFTAAHPQLKANNKWQEWSTYLESMVKYSQHKATVLQHRLGTATPYDALLSWYSGGATAQELTTSFQPYAKAFPELLQHALDKQNSSPQPEPLPVVSAEKQEALSHKILKMIHFDFEKGSTRTHTSAFCSTAHGNTFVQVRMVSENILAMIRTSCHEGGHGLYHQGLPKAEIGKPIGEVQSYLISEMIAYLYEHHVALHPAFLARIADEIDMDPNLLIAHARKVTPSTVSTECDELSLSIHPLIRFPFDRDLINGDVNIEDLPQLWNAQTSKLLGMDTGDAYNRSVMAPVHWAKGFFGYFPIYLSAKMAAAQLAKALDVTNLFNQYSIEHALFILKKELEKVVFSYGGFLSTPDLIKEATGKELAATDLIEHLRKRYT